MPAQFVGVTDAGEHEHHFGFRPDLLGAAVGEHLNPYCPVALDEDAHDERPGPDGQIRPVTVADKASVRRTAEPVPDGLGPCSIARKVPLTASCPHA